MRMKDTPPPPLHFTAYSFLSPSLLFIIVYILPLSSEPISSLFSHLTHSLDPCSLFLIRPPIQPDIALHRCKNIASTRNHKVPQ